MISASDKPGFSGLIFVILVVVLLCSTNAGYADVSTLGGAGTGKVELEATVNGGNDVDIISDQIIEKEIELAKLTTNYRLHNPYQTELHKWFKATFSTAAYSLADSGNFTIMRTTYLYRDKPSQLSTGRAESGPFLILLGETMFFSRTLGLTLLDLMHAQQIHSRGFDRKIFENKAAQLETDIQTLLSKRKEMVAGSLNTAYSHEQNVLSDINLALSQEFVKNYARSKRIEVFHATENLMGNFTSSTGLFVGALYSYEAAVHTKPRLCGASGIGYLVSGLGFMTTDFLSYNNGRRAEKKTRATMAAKHGVQLQDISKQLDQDKLEFSLMAVSDPKLHKRDLAYGLLQTCLTKELTIGAVEDREYWHKFLHDITINTAEGGAHMGAGTLTAEAGFGYLNTSPANFVTADNRAKEFIKRFGTAAIVFTPTASGGIVDTPGEAIYSEIRRKKDNSQHISPEVGLRDRLSLLDQAEKTIK